MSLNSTFGLVGTFGGTINTVGQQYIIGERLDTVANAMNANMARVSIYNVALSEAEITQNFEALRSIYGV